MHQFSISRCLVWIARSAGNAMKEPHNATPFLWRSTCPSQFKRDHAEALCFSAFRPAFYVLDARNQWTRFGIVLVGEEGPCKVVSPSRPSLSIGSRRFGCTSSPQAELCTGSKSNRRSWRSGYELNVTLPQFLSSSEFVPGVGYALLGGWSHGRWRGAVGVAQRVTVAG